jgi:hypothetical protein
VNGIDTREEHGLRDSEYGYRKSGPYSYKWHKSVHSAPWWVGQEGYEELTSRWPELNAVERQK